MTVRQNGKVVNGEVCLGVVKEGTLDEEPQRYI